LGLQAEVGSFRENQDTNFRLKAELRLFAQSLPWGLGFFAQSMRSWNSAFSHYLSSGGIKVNLYKGLIRPVKAACGGYWWLLERFSSDTVWESS
jgi:hypothetical protein